ncbi:MAG TPA: hypothetical protein VFQ61_35380 [Polyangiaceae bacterium]|nr:hypothetical protein [Polyangiaceae bacterium]
MLSSLRISILLGFVAAAVSACSSDSEDAPAQRTREAFCRDWAQAACSEQTVSACQAASPEACRASQVTFCESLVPSTFSDTQGDKCIQAVKDAYSDADLTATELTTVLKLDGACAVIVRGNRGKGESCSSTRDCDASTGYECVIRGGQTSGTCQIPEEVGAGQRCSALQQVCGAGFYCDGSNCIAAKEAGDSCVSDVECGEAGLCAGSECVDRAKVGSACTADEECISGICYTVNGAGSCVDRIRLSPAESACQDLR